MMLESRKIMGLPNLKVSATCVRVPVVRAHSISVTAEFEKPVSVEAAREAVASFAGAMLRAPWLRAEFTDNWDWAALKQAVLSRFGLNKTLSPSHTARLPDLS